MLLQNSLLNPGWALTHRGQVEKRMTDYGFESLLSDRLKVFKKVDTQSSLPFPCQKFPYMCKAPLNCHEVSQRDLLPLAQNGHANVRSWCNLILFAFWESIGKECIANHDLTKNSLELFNVQSHLMLQELDASYCFFEGHCSNRWANPNTTIEEAEQMCDHRFGHDGWTSNFFMSDLKPLVIKTLLDTIFFHPLTAPLELINGIHEQKLTRFFAKLACVMGNFHCDVQYCKQTYCSMKHYQDKYKHLLPKIAGDEIQDLSAW